MKRAAIYARVSTRNGHQDPETQLLALRQVAERAGWQVVEEYVDRGISGAKGRDQRPAFDQLLRDATRRRFDIIMAWSVDRLGRSLQDLVAFLDKARAKGKQLGRPKVSPSVEHSIRAAREAGKGQLAIACDLHVGVSTVRRVLGTGAGTEAPASKR
jgi:DNA invertase Pin-like site-specific DNA recombinase